MMFYYSNKLFRATIQTKLCESMMFKALANHPNCVFFKYYNFVLCPTHDGIALLKLLNASSIQCNYQETTVNIWLCTGHTLKCEL